jgi:hypothetical protein
MLNVIIHPLATHEVIYDDARPVCRSRNRGFLICVSQANAGVISVVGDTGDGQIGADGSIAGIPVQSDRTGTGGDNSRGLALIYFFALPTLSPGGTIINAELQFDFVEKTNTPEFNIDLFGIDARPTQSFLRVTITMVTWHRVPIR